MNPEAHTPQPAPTEDVAEKDIVLNPEYKANSHAAAMFGGDKHTALTEQTLSEVSLEGQSIAEKYFAGDKTKEAAKRAAGTLAINQAAMANDWSKERIDLAKKELEARLEAN